MDVSVFQAVSRDALHHLFAAAREAFEEHLNSMVACQRHLLQSVRGSSEEAKPCAEKCSFERWYAGPQPDELLADKEFMALGELHRRFHEAEKEACRADGEPPSAARSAALLEAQRDFLLALNHFVCEVAGGERLFDPLTGLLNRQAMIRLLRREQSRAQRTGQPCSIAIADLDHFKRVNDTFGHDAGDRVLELTGKRFAAELRAYDLLFRYGGEEFLFCLPSSDIREARGICERVRRLVETNDIQAAEGRTVRVTASFGIAPLSPDRSVEQCIREADAALYEAKAAGRNRTCIVASP